MGAYLTARVEGYCFTNFKALARQSSCFVKFRPIVCLDVDAAFKVGWQS